MNDADQIVMDAQAFVSEFGSDRHGEPIQALLNAVSGVSTYRMGGGDQGYIARKFMGERIENNHVVDFGSVVSHFWNGVFKYLPKAVRTGDEVQARDAEIGSHATAPKQHGRTYQRRATKMPPLTFLRMQGVASARKYITECYKRALRQQCLDCGTVQTLGTTKEFDDGCPKCKSMDSAMIAGVMRRRTRKCSNCQLVRPCTIKRLCGHPKEAKDGSIVYEGGCGSTEIIVVQSEEFISSDREKWESTLGADTKDPEVEYIQNELTNDSAEFAKACLQSMPSDPRDPTGDSQSRKILRILTVPSDGVDICKKCVTSAPTVCSKGCGKADCAHSRMADPRQSCGASSFSLASCVNYSRKLGEHLGYTPSLANRRVAKVREHVKKFAKTSARQFATARFFHERLEQDGV